jgi:hypothetical protein
VLDGHLRQPDESKATLSPCACWRQLTKLPRLQMNSAY